MLESLSSILNTLRFWKNYGSSILSTLEGDLFGGYWMVLKGLGILGVSFVSFVISDNQANDTLCPVQCQYLHQKPYRSTVPWTVFNEHNDRFWMAGLLHSPPGRVQR